MHKKITQEQSTAKWRQIIYKLLAAENEQLTKEQLKERLIRLTENSVLEISP